MKHLCYTVENGKILWRAIKKGDPERHVDAPCDAMRRARDQALRVTRDIEREARRMKKMGKKEDAGDTPPDIISDNAGRREERI